MTKERDMLKSALLDALSGKYDEELSKSEGDISCSKKHYSKLSNILGVSVGGARRFSKRLLAAILVAVFLLTGCTVYAYRTEIKEFFVEIYEKYIRVTYDTDANTVMGKSIEKVYKANYIPEGYELVEEVNTQVDVSYKWKDKNGNIITLQQKILDGTDFYVDAEHGLTESINCNKYKVYCRFIDNSYHYIWNNEKYVFALESKIELDNDVLSKIIAGIE